jgi:integrase/recombinase XerC
MLKQFITHVAQEHAPRTVKGYAHDVKSFIGFFKGSNGAYPTPQTITPTDAKEFRQFLIQKNFSPATINRKLIALKNFFKFYGVPLELRLLPTPELAPHWLDRRQQAALVREAEKQINAANTEERKARAIRDHAIVIFLLNTGLRVSELCALGPDDVTLGERSGSLMVRFSKRDRSRVVPLNTDARKALAVMPLPLRLKVLAVQRIVAELGRRAGLEVSPHTLRHTFAKNLMDAHQDITRVAALMGHANLNTTRIYTAPGERDLRQAVEALE